MQGGWPGCRRGAADQAMQASRCCIKPNSRVPMPAPLPAAAGFGPSSPCPTPRTPAVQQLGPERLWPCNNVRPSRPSRVDSSMPRLSLHFPYPIGPAQRRGNTSLPQPLNCTCSLSRLFVSGFPASFTLPRVSLPLCVSLACPAPSLRSHSCVPATHSNSDCYAPGAALKRGHEEEGVCRMAAWGQGRRQPFSTQPFTAAWFALQPEVCSVECTRHPRFSPHWTAPGAPSRGSGASLAAYECTTRQGSLLGAPLARLSPAQPPPLTAAGEPAGSECRWDPLRPAPPPCEMLAGSCAQLSRPGLQPAQPCTAALQTNRRPAPLCRPTS